MTNAGFCMDRYIVDFEVIDRFGKILNRINTTGPTINDNTFLVLCADITPKCYIPGFQYHANTSCFKRTSTTVIFSWIIAKKRQMSNIASRSNASFYRVYKSVYTDLSQSIQIRGLCSFNWSQ